MNLGDYLKDNDRKKLDESLKPIREKEAEETRKRMGKLFHKLKSIAKQQGHELITNKGRIEQIKFKEITLSGEEVKAKVKYVHGNLYFIDSKGYRHDVDKVLGAMINHDVILI